MKYFFDCEFIEDFHKPLFGKKRHYIDLISIAIVCEDGRSLYAISKDFDIKDVWYKWQKKQCCSLPIACSAMIQGVCPGYEKEYWMRNNVLEPIHKHLYNVAGPYAKTYHHELIDYNLKGMKNLIRWHGLHNAEIATRISEFCQPADKNDTVEFYAYYGDYDWVLLCSLFGKMLNLPDHFPMFAYDLKQMMDDTANRLRDRSKAENPSVSLASFDDYLKGLKNSNNYPKQNNAHDAQDDAYWNRKLYYFLKNLEY